MTTAQEKKIKKFCKHLVREKGEIREFRSVFPDGVDKIARQIDIALEQVGSSRGYDYLVKDYLEAQIGLINHQKELLKYLEKLSSSVDDLIAADHTPLKKVERSIFISLENESNSLGAVEMYIDRIKSSLVSTHNSLTDANPWSAYWSIKRLKDEIARFVQR